MENSINKKLRYLSWLLSQSFMLKQGRLLWEENKKDHHIRLSKYQKLITGLYLISLDFSRGLYPPKFEDQQKVYDNEINYSLQWAGLSIKASFEAAQTKPFWFNASGTGYLQDFIDVVNFLRTLDIRPPMNLLEIGCGTGWMAEFLSTMGFDVVGTTLSPHDIQAANCRIQSLKAKGLDKKLSFLSVPMENLEESLDQTFDCIYVYEALHHAYSWQETIQSCFNCLKPNGWLLVCNEPNLIHTAVSYRVSILTNTHEIGFNRKELVKYMQKVGFKDIKILKNSFTFGIKSLWIAAQKSYL